MINRERHFPGRKKRLFGRRFFHDDPENYKKTRGNGGRRNGEGTIGLPRQGKGKMKIRAKSSIGYRILGGRETSTKRG